MTREALAAWRQRFTEREEWRLTEHFFRALFDFGFLSDLAADSFKRVLIGSVGGFIAFGRPGEEEAGQNRRARRRMTPPRT